MNTAKPITPTDAGLSLSVIAGPRASNIDEWPSIEYVCELLNARRQVIWRGEYRLGIGHVKVPRHFPSFKYTTDEQRILERWNADLNADGKKAQAQVAAKLAKEQKVAPKLDNVCASLLFEGAAFFDGMRLEDWCAELGYDSDSRKAEATYRACDEIGRVLSRHLSRDALAGLREWANNQ